MICYFVFVIPYIWYLLYYVILIYRYLLFVYFFKNNNKPPPCNFVSVCISQPCNCVPLYYYNIYSIIVHIFQPCRCYVMLYIDDNIYRYHLSYFFSDNNINRPFSIMLLFYKFVTPPLPHTYCIIHYQLYPIQPPRKTGLVIKQKTTHLGGFIR